MVIRRRRNDADTVAVKCRVLMLASARTIKFQCLLAAPVLGGKLRMGETLYGRFTQNAYVHRSTGKSSLGLRRPDS